MDHLVVLAADSAGLWPVRLCHNAKSQELIEPDAPHSEVDDRQFISQQLASTAIAMLWGYCSTARQIPVRCRPQTAQTLAQSVLIGNNYRGDAKCLTLQFGQKKRAGEPCARPATEAATKSITSSTVEPVTSSIDVDLARLRQIYPSP